jgi:hypothetical protein
VPGRGVPARLDPLSDGLRCHMGGSSSGSAAYFLLNDPIPIR